MGPLTRLAGQQVYLDTNVFIYAVEQTNPFVTASRALLDSIDAGLLSAVTSELPLAEVLVVPFRRKDESQILNYQESVSPTDGLSGVPVSRAILVEAARLRARHGWRLPDAIHVATAFAASCSAFVTNDDRLRGLPIEVIRLTDLLE